MGISLNGLTSTVDTGLSGVSTESANKLSGSLKGISSDSSEDELLEVIEDFESYFVEEMIKKVKETFTDSGSDEEGVDKTASSYTDFFMDYAIEDLSDEILDEVGGNVTQQLYEQMKRNYNISLRYYGGCANAHPLFI